MAGFYNPESRETTEGSLPPGRGFDANQVEKFNFDNGDENFPGDERNDIPTLPNIESLGDRDPNLRNSDRKSTSYFDIMSDFFDEPRIDLVPKNVVTRQAPFAPARPSSPGFFGRQQQQPKLRHLSRQIAPVTQIGHTYTEPLNYRNPLDTGHNDADVGFYQGPKYGGVPNKKQGGIFPPPPPPPARPFQAHVPRLLDDVNSEVDFIDVPKVGPSSPPPVKPTREFFGQALTQREPPRPRSGFDSGAGVPRNFPRPDISSQLDSVPRNGGFADSIFDRPNFNVEQNFGLGFDDVDDGTFNSVESLPRPERLVGAGPPQNIPGEEKLINPFSP